MRRSERAITDRARLYQILDELPVCRIALHDRPFPYVVPVNFVRIDQRLYFHTAPAGHKMRLLADDPRVRFEVDRLLTVTGDQTACQWGALYESVSGVGEATVVESESEAELALRQLMAKYSGSADWTFSAAALARVRVVRIDIQGLEGKASL